MKTENGKPKPLKETVGNVTVKIYRCRRTIKTGPSKGESYETFQVADYSAGERKLITFADRNEAVKEANRIARLLASGEVAALDMRPSQRASYGCAVEHLRPTGVSLEAVASQFATAFRIVKGENSAPDPLFNIVDAIRFYAKKNPERLPQVAVKTVIDELIESKKAAGKSDRYLKDLDYRLGAFSEKFEVSIGSVAAPEIQRFLDGLKLSNRSYINFRRVIGTLFRFAKRRGYLPKDNDEADNLDKRDGMDGEITIYTPAEIVRLLNAASVAFRPCLAIGAFAGLRSSEVERLDWRHIDLKRKFITVQGARKRGTPSRRVVPITGNLAAWLAKCVKASGKLWSLGHDSYYDAQQDAAKDAGIEWRHNALRHSFISYRLAAVQNINQVALEAGNSGTTIHTHYKELVTPADAKRWFAVRPPKEAA
jgi:integrase